MADKETEEKLWRKKIRRQRFVLFSGVVALAGLATAYLGTKDPLDRAPPNKPPPTPKVVKKPFVVPEFK